MEKLYYYLRNKDHKPVVSVCLLVIGRNISRGVAVCADLDHPCKKRGRGIATQRAWYAMRHQLSCGTLAILSEKTTKIMLGCDAPGELLEGKSVFAPILTDYEKKLINLATSRNGIANV